METTVDAKGEPVVDNRIILWQRSRCVENRDPMRRCYYGTYADAVLSWTQWVVFDRIPPEKAERQLAVWVDLNDYAVSQRGESAKCEYVLRRPEEGPPEWLPGKPVQYVG
jgi:hypothetical protein